MIGWGRRIPHSAFRVPVLALVAAVASAAPPAGKAPRAFPVEAAPVSARPVVYAVEATGSLETDERKVSCEVAGTVRSLGFEEGDDVTAEKVLAEIDPERYRLLAAKAKASFEKAQAQAADAANALARRRKLRERNAGWVPEEEIERLEAAHAAARAAEQEAKASWDLAAEDQRRSQVRAPVAGRIERRQLVLGQYVAPGTQAATLMDPRLMRLRFRVAEVESGGLAQGQGVAFRTRAHPGQAFSGKLIHVSAQADPASRAVECVALVENPDGILRSGMFAEVQIEISRKERAVAVPESALLPTERGYVAFVAEGGVARRREVSLGLHLKGGEVEVTKGLADGEMLVTRGANLLTDGAAIEIVKGK